jgi:TP53 regulating kinase-like protein
MEYIDNSILARDFINNVVKDLKDETLCLTKLHELADEIGRFIGMLHRNDIIHGDLTTSNIMIKKPVGIENVLKIEKSQLNIIIIDFGLSFISHQLEDKAVDLYVLERALISTHSQYSKDIFDRILQSYCKEYGRNNEKVVERFEQVRLRGRKRTMIG